MFLAWRSSFVRPRYFPILQLPRKWTGAAPAQLQQRAAACRGYGGGQLTVISAPCTGSQGASCSTVGASTNAAEPR